MSVHFSGKNDELTPDFHVWREVSKTLAAVLFAFFLAVGWIAGMLF